jgi:phosphatidylserine/phosphatidylglycerophosphate/cardiolipin synthase-like enzyme
MAKTDVGILGKEISHMIIPVVDRNYFPAAKKLIQEAEKSICISMFVMKRGKKVNSFVNLLIEELKNANKRGIKIKLLLENKKVNQPTVDFLRDIRNIEIKFDSPQKTTHNKIVLIDQNTILIGSTNWTEKSIGHANEANVVIKDKEVTEYFQEYFDRLWKDSSKDISPFKNFTGDIIPLIDRQYFDVVKELMSKSTQRILVMVYGYKLRETGDTKAKGDILADETIKAKRRKVETKVLLEKSNFSKQLNKMNSETIEYFKKNGVDARVDSKNIITHSKVVIIDDTVILGATNWSYSGLEKWHNTDILIRKREIVDFFVNYFEEKFNSNL